MSFSWYDCDDAEAKVYVCVQFIDFNNDPAGENSVFIPNMARIANDTSAIAYVTSISAVQGPGSTNVNFTYSLIAEPTYDHPQYGDLEVFFSDDGVPSVDRNVLWENKVITFGWLDVFNAISATANISLTAIGTVFPVIILARTKRVFVVTHQLRQLKPENSDVDLTSGAKSDLTAPLVDSK